MRLFLLPVSTRRTLLYAQRLNGTASTVKPDAGLVDKTTTWAAKKWAQWEKRESGWQRKVELVFPARAFGADQAPAVALKLATERLRLHRKNMIWCFVSMPITAPFVLIPIIPNLPFFYLVYRAWFHWRAIAGGRHLQWLVENKLVMPSPSATLDQLYDRDAPLPSPETPPGQESMLPSQKQVRGFSKTLNIPELEIELERAVWQVETQLYADRPSSESHAGARPEGPRGKGSFNSWKEVKGRALSLARAYFDSDTKKASGAMYEEMENRASAAACP